MAVVKVTYEDEKGNVTTRVSEVWHIGNPEFTAAQVLNRGLEVLGGMVELLQGDPYRDCHERRMSEPMRTKLVVKYTASNPKPRTEGWNQHGHWVGHGVEPKPSDVINYLHTQARCGGPVMCPLCTFDDRIIPIYTEEDND